MTEPIIHDEWTTLYHGDCLDVLRVLSDASVDSVVCDPPYGLSNTDPAHVAETITRWVNGERDYLPPVKGGFMGKAWDSFVPPVAVWDECYRVLKPGGHVLAFAGSRTHDLMTLGIRLAGFEIRDSIAWLYSQGFPKSLDVSKAIDKAAGATREVVGLAGRSGSGRTSMDAGTRSGDLAGNYFNTAPATPDAERWQGWGTALKPAFEPIVCARKPLSGSTVAANVLQHGTGALNIDACRVGRAEGDRTEYGRGLHLPHANTTASLGKFAEVTPYTPHDAGRWPTNVLLDDSQAEVLDEQGTGGASRFFPTFRYQAKAPASERPKVNGIAHPTVKPLTLMSWLVRLVTPPGGTVLNPFTGSGTTVEACIIEGFHCIAIEREADYLPLIEQRINRSSGLDTDSRGEDDDD